MERRLKELYRMLPTLVKAIFLTIATGLIGVYNSSQPYHYVKNGLPFPFLVQVIDIEAAEYVEIKIDPLFLVIDILVWTGFILLLRLFGRILKRTPSPRVD
ncbi:MAG: hypothetical protein QXN75_05600 [Thermoproteota archaeon]|nr:hypothetical protein [Candidatus Brockarchaeota archaeon]